MWLELDKYNTFAKWVSANRIILDGQYICAQCTGSGKIYHPDSEPDSYEGNKLRDTIKCPTCNGSKIGSESYWKEYYGKIKKIHLEKKKFESLYNKRRKEILKKAKKALTKEELQFMEWI